MPDGTLLLATGDGFDFREQAQNLDAHFGKMLRMNADGGAEQTIRLPITLSFTATVTAIPKAWPSPATVPSMSTSMAQRVATRSTSSPQGAIMAGRSPHTVWTITAPMFRPLKPEMASTRSSHLDALDSTLRLGTL